jgi:hypothetical protein
LPFLLALWLGPALSPTAWASAARDELLRLVPDDVGLCLVISDLRGQTEKFVSAPWVKRLTGSPLGRALDASPEMRKLDKLEEVFRRKLGLGLDQLRDDILGDAVVLAYRFGPPGKPEQEQGLLLLRARDEGLLARLVERVTRDLKESGELKELEPRDYRGVRYYCGKKADRVDYYFVSGTLLALAGREDLLRAVMDRRLAPADGRPASAAARGLRGTEEALAALWLNPRAFDAELRDKEARADGLEARVLRTFRGYWRALDDITVALAVAPEPGLRVTLRGRPEALPPACRRLLAAAARPSELWARFPEDAVLTAVGRTDFAAFNGVVGDFLTPAVRQARRTDLQRTLGAALGMDLFQDVLPCLGPDWGLCVAEAPGRAGFPHVLIALRVRHGPTSTPVDQALVKALEFVAGLVAFEHNRSHDSRVRLQGLKQGTVAVKYLGGAGAFPGGAEPAFALKGGYLVLASSPAAVERFGAGRAAAPAAADVPLLRLSLRELARLLQERREPVTAYLADKNHLAPEAARGLLDGVLAVLAVADRLEVTQRAGPGRVTWSLRLSLDRKTP